MKYSSAKMVTRIQTYSGKDAAYGLLRLQEGYDEFIQGKHPESGVVHQWSFLRPQAELTLAILATVTATGIYSAGTGLTTITAKTAGTGMFAPWHVGRTITCPTVGALTIAGYTSCDVVTVTGSYAFAEGSCTYDSQGEYDLPELFGGLVTKPEYLYSDTYECPAWRRVGPETIYAHWAEYEDTGTPWLYAIVPAPFNEDNGERWRILVAPRPEVARTIKYRYNSLVATVANDAHYLPGAAEHGLTIEALGLAAHETESKIAGPWIAKANRFLGSSIDHDKAKYDHIEQEDLERDDDE